MNTIDYKPLFSRNAPNALHKKAMFHIN